MIVKTLRQLKPGDSAVISVVRGKSAIRRRLADMGVTKGTELYVEKVAPLGDPIEIKIKGYHLTLRKHDADNIIIIE